MIVCECMRSFWTAILCAWLIIASPLEAVKNINYIYPLTSKQGQEGGRLE